MLPLLAASVAVLAGQRLRSLLSWWHGLVLLDALPHPKVPPGLGGFLGGHVAVVRQPTFYKTFDAWAATLGGIFSCRIMWLKVRTAAAGLSPPACLAKSSLHCQAFLDFWCRCRSTAQVVARRSKYHLGHSEPYHGHSCALHALMGFSTWFNVLLTLARRRRTGGYHHGPRDCASSAPSRALGRGGARGASCTVSS